MTDLIILFVFNALFILGVYNAFSPGQIFGFVRKLVLSGGHAELKIEITKPIYGCFVCMPSIWGTMGYLLFSDYQWYYFPIYVFCLSGLMFIIKELLYE